MQPLCESNRKLKGSRNDARHRAALALFVAISIISLGTFAKATAAVESRTVAGFISVQGIVNVNGQRATEGQTLFAKSIIETASSSESLITLRNGSRVNLSADGALTIESSERDLLASMHNGRALLNIPAGVILDFSTADVSLNKKSVAEAVLVMVEATECAGTRLSVMSGQLEVHHNGRARVVKSGESLSTSAAQTGQQQQTQNSFDKKKLGIIFGIGGAVAILLAVALGNNDENQQAPGGGVICAPSPGSGGPCN
jgi:ferric-dicitrate binding protein FerR (iron transport regulator)